jgi:hypothetical protein
MQKTFIIKENYQKEINKYKCFFTDNKQNFGHFLYNPISLPCSNTVCNQCIQPLLNSKSNFFCKLCNNYHNIENIKRKQETDLSSMSFFKHITNEIDIELLNGIFI